MDGYSASEDRCQPYVDLIPIEDSACCPTKRNRTVIRRRCEDAPIRWWIYPNSALACRPLYLARGHSLPLRCILARVVVPDAGRGRA